MKKTRFSVLLALLLGILTITLWWSCKETPTDIEIQPPAAPTGLTATAASQTQINLSWTASTGATSYAVYRRFVTGEYSRIAHSVTKTNYSDTTLSCSDPLALDTFYEYYVIAYNAGGSSSASNTAHAMTNQCTPTTPAAPTGLTATPYSQTQIVLSWTASTGATSYTLSRTGYGVIYTGGLTSFSNTGLTVNTSYSYTVTASNTGGTSASSTPASATTNACVVVPSSPSISATPVPGNPKATTSGTGNASDYLVYYSLEGGTVAQYQLYAHTNSLSLTIPLSCPKKYRLVFFGYNIDTSLGGATHSSCSGLGTLGEVDSALGTTYASNKKCAPKVEVPVTIDYCSQGFFGD